MALVLNDSLKPAFISASLLAVVGCLPGASKTVVLQASSPEYIATIAKRNSGAPSKGSTLVSVHLAGAPDDDTHGTIVLGLTGDKSIGLKWSDPHHLALTCESCKPEDVNFEVTKAGDVFVTYDSNLRVDSSPEQSH